MGQPDDELYQERILDHNEQPYHRGHCPGRTHSHEDDNPLCGDVIRVELAVDADRRIQQAWFSGDGCCISQAAASMLMQTVEGKSLDEVRQFQRSRYAPAVRSTAHAQSSEMLPARLASPSRGAVLAGSGTDRAARKVMVPDEHCSSQTD